MTDFEEAGGGTLSLGDAGESPAKERAEVLLSRGEVIAGKYRAEELLGAGGMGVVWSATHLGHGGTVAVKLLSKKGWTPTARILREARTVAALRSPRVVRLLDVDQLATGEPFLVFEHLQGVSLAQVLAEQGAIPWRVAVRYLLDACEGLAEAHSSGVIHRDLKPSNLFLCEEPPESARIKVIDFGVARVASEECAAVTLTGESGLLGSLPYAAPEQLRSSRSVDARADVWSLGVTLFELISGRLPFREQTPAGLAAAISCDVPPRLRSLCREVPPSLDALVQSCLSKSPEQRPPDAAVLAERLRGVLQGRRAPAGWLGLLALASLGLGVSQVLLTGSAPRVQAPDSPVEPGVVPVSTQTASVTPPEREVAPLPSSTMPSPEPDPRVPPGRGGGSRKIAPRALVPATSISSAVPRHEIEHWSRK